MQKSTTLQSQIQPGYRWVIVAAAALMLAIAMGQLVNGFSAYFIPLETEFGWPRRSIALVNTIGLIALAVGGIALGPVTDRIGVRPVALAGSMALGVCVTLASQASELWHFYVLYAIAGALGGGALFAPLMALVGNWFWVGAGLAIGLASAGQAAGQGGVPFVSTLLIDGLGWRNALLASGLFSLATLVPLSLLLRTAPRPPAKTAQAAAADESPTGLPTPVVVVWMSVAILTCCTCMAVPLMHLVPLIQGRGIAATDAGSVIFVMLLVAIAGRVAFGKLADIIGPIPAYMTASAWQTLLVFFFTQIDTLGGFYVFAVIYGFGYAGVMTGVLVTIRALTPLSSRATSTGIILAFGWLGHGLGGFQGGYFYDITGAYTQTFANASFSGMINLIVVGALWWTISRGRPHFGRRAASAA